MGILTLIKSNFKHKKASTISVIILMFIISISLTTIISSNINISNRYNEAVENVKVGDLNFFINEFNDVDEIIKKIEGNDNIEYISNEKMIASKISINKNASGSSVFIKKYNADTFNYNVYDKNERNFIDNPEKLKENEAYVPISFKEIYKCDIGDKIQIGNKEILIKGFIEEPFVGSSTMGIKIFYIDEKSFDELYDIRLRDEESFKERKEKAILGANLVSIYKKDSSNISSVLLKKEINKESNIVDLSTFSLSKDQSKEYTEMFSTMISGILFAFIFLLFIVVLIVVSHSISTSIEMDYVNLGILKSQGFTKAALRKIYLYQYLISQLVGIILGIVTSIFVIPYVGSIFATITGLLPSNKIAIKEVILLLGAIIIISSMFIFYKTRRIGNVSPVSAISGCREQIYFNRSIKIPINKKALSVLLAIRQLLSNKKQYISSLLIVTLLSFFMISVTSLKNIMTEKYFSELFGGIISDFYIVYNNSIDLKEEIEDKIEDISNIEEKFHIKNDYFTVDEEEICGQVLENPKLYKSITEGRAPKYDNEIIVTEIVSELLDKKIGDKVQITNKDKTKEYIISGYYQSTTDVGYVFGMTLDGVKRLNENYNSNSCDYIVKDKDKIKEIVKSIKDEYGDKVNIVNSSETDNTIQYILIGVDVINYIIYVLSIIFVLVVSIMVCGRMFLKERNEFGIYKSQGFTTNYLRLLFSIRFFIVALIGSILGFVLNYFFNDTLMSSLLRSVGIYKFETMYTASTILVPCVLISLSYFIFSFVISSRIKKVSVKELIIE